MAKEDTQFKPGQSGNPAGGGARPRLFLDALNRSIAQDDGKKLRQAAEKLIALAVKGEAWAIQMLAERLDGKVAQAITGEGGGPVQFEQIVRTVVDPAKGAQP